MIRLAVGHVKQVADPGNQPWNRSHAGGPILVADDGLPPLGAA